MTATGPTRPGTPTPRVAPPTQHPFHRLRELSREAVRPAAETDCPLLSALADRSGRYLLE
jgi:hypothetical protein